MHWNRLQPRKNKIIEAATFQALRQGNGHVWIAEIGREKPMQPILPPSLLEEWIIDGNSLGLDSINYEYFLSK